MSISTAKPLHAGDLRIRAWGATREECVAQTVSALVAGFVPRLPRQTSATEFDVHGDTDVALLVGVLRTVISGIGARNEIPVAADVWAAPNGLRVRLGVADLAGVVAVGAVPKGVSAQHVRFAPRTDGWWCAACVDL
ncbi:archease [Amycolatopsis panacis]|uniref:archease n=1 Tax=Amycolatopsis panacis TaxID=2340917 RepID=UPI0013147569|nr:archease [Amycolatopsis panacis]